MESKRSFFSMFLNLLLVLCVLFIPWWIGYIINDSVLYGFIYAGYFVLGNVVGTLLGILIVRFIKRKKS